MVVKYTKVELKMKWLGRQLRAETKQAEEEQVKTLIRIKRLEDIKPVEKKSGRLHSV